ncbi:MAG: L-aspartate oxidase [Longimicrobiales bacterium]
MRRDARVLVIGSGVAGLTFALHAAELARVTIITKKHRADSNTNYAQGGIAAVMDPADSLGAHVRDTMVAGAGLCHRARVELVVREGPERVRELMDWGVAFTRSGGGLSLGREGGHSHRRIIHAADRTGREVERALLQAVSEHPAIEILDDHVAIDLVVGEDVRTRAPRNAGALVLDEPAGSVRFIDAAVTFLAAGGLGRIYRHTTNPAIATGDGVALAWRAGVAVANLEFVQFHPTALYPAEDRAILISEAVRGEGAVLRSRDGRALLDDVHPHGSLAPRDVVARAIDRELKATGAPHVWLDATGIPAVTIEARFPNILSDCLEAGIDLRTAPIPVVPAAHYACGGVLTDSHARTTLASLFAAGEVACTGVHGANRLASNSLLEAVVLTAQAAAALPAALAAADAGVEHPPAGPCPPRGHRDAAAKAGAITEEIRALMWDEVGIVRSSARLELAQTRIEALALEANALLAHAGAVPEALEARNMADAAGLVVRCARHRPESRGLHYLEERPFRDNERCLRDTVLDVARQSTPGGMR